MVQEGPNKFPEYTTRLAKAFLRGKSSNITKDTITAPDRTANS